MSLGPPPRPGRPVPLAAFLVLAATALAPAAPDPLPPFAGPPLPRPPQQDRPWTAPATALPRFLVSTTASLAEQGLPDPRGCEYREVELAGEDKLLRNPAQPRPRTHAWVIPAAEGPPGPRFAIAWNGLIYPLISIGEPANLDADVAAAKDPARDQPWEGRSWFGEITHLTSAQQAPSRPLHACLLLRLGRVDLAERSFAACTRWKPGAGGRDLTSYGVSYLSLASDWAWALFDRAGLSHAARNDPLALADARELGRVAPLIEARLAALGFNDRADPNNSGRPLEFLKPLPRLLADQERRAMRPGRAVPPVPELEKIADPAARVAALIDSLDEEGFQGGTIGTSYFSPESKDRAVAALVRQGEAAVEPLIAAFESDQRLTRAVRGDDRHGTRVRWFSPTFRLAYNALTQILGTTQFSGGGQDAYPSGDEDLAARKPRAEAIRAYVAKFRGVSDADRRYRILADDRASTAQWLEAAGWITANPDPAKVRYRPLTSTPTRDRIDPKEPRRGDALRAGKSPTVSELLARRAEDLSQKTEVSRSMASATSLAIALAYWDAEAARPVLARLARRCNDMTSGKLKERFGGQISDEAAHLAEITVARTRIGDPGALADYVEMLPRLGPESIQYRVEQVLRPMMDHPDDPAIVRASEAMFLGPASPWQPLFNNPKDPNLWSRVDQLVSGPLIGVAAFRALLVRSLGDRSPFGFASLDETGQSRYRTLNGGSGGRSPSLVDPDGPKAMTEVPIRACDYLAWTMTSALDGLPPVMPYWPEDRRDRAIADQVAFLQRYGERFGPSPIRDALANRIGRQHREPVFPPLDRPATADEARRGLAIFSLEGQGPARAVPLAGLPLAAQWVALRDYPFLQQTSGGPGGKPATNLTFDQDGLVWQAEEVEEGGRWRRYYGFAGRRIGRVPAEEIEFSERWSSWAKLSDKADVLIAAIPGKPREFSIRIRNRGGLPRAVPTSFLAPDRPALRPGVVPVLEYVPGQVRTGFGLPDVKREEIPAKSTARFDPDPATRTLEPAEAIDAFVFRLDDWFDTARPGTYGLRFRFTAESGLGEGASYYHIFLDPAPAPGQPGGVFIDG